MNSMPVVNSEVIVTLDRAPGMVFRAVYQEDTFTFYFTIQEAYEFDSESRQSFHMDPVEDHELLGSRISPLTEGVRWMSVNEFFGGEPTRDDEV